MQIVRTVPEVRAAVRAARAAGQRVGFVPTMGALHDGHLSLVTLARERGAAFVVVSVFVNPTQFGPNEDFAAYPRDLDGDADKLRSVRADVVFFPDVETIYPPGAETRVSLDAIPKHLCGLDRPHHFGGVATVVTGLLNIVQPDLAVFGEKDFQQLQVIRRLVRDLHLPVEIVGAPISREADGLAMSSRNAYLSPDERRRALALSTALSGARAAADAGVRDLRQLEAAMREVCEASGGQVDYAAVVDPDTLDPATSLPARALVAVRFGRTRLIDNTELS
jgi:pantoate--beta-alanine ligase